MWISRKLRNLKDVTTRPNVPFGTGGHKSLNLGISNDPSTDSSLFNFDFSDFLDNTSAVIQLISLNRISASGNVCLNNVMFFFQ